MDNFDWSGFDFDKYKLETEHTPNIPLVVGASTPTDFIEAFDGPSDLTSFDAFKVVGQQAFGASPSAGFGHILPRYGDLTHHGPPGTYDRWQNVYVSPDKIQQPTRVVYTYIDPASKNYLCSDGKTTQYEAIKEGFLDFGRVCGAVFYEVPYEHAEIKFRMMTPDWIYYYSRIWGSYGDTRVGGVYYAAKAGHPEILFGPYNKYTVKWTNSGWDWSQAKTNSQLVVRRIIRYGLFLHWGWPLQNQSIPNFAADWPGLAGPIRYHAKNELIKTLGLAGFDMRNINWLSTKYGPLWLWKEERALK